VCKKLSGGVLTWSSAWDEVHLHMAQLMPLPLTVSCSSIVNPGWFYLSGAWCRLTRAVTDAHLQLIGDFETMDRPILILTLTLTLTTTLLIVTLTEDIDKNAATGTQTWDAKRTAKASVKRVCVCVSVCRQNQKLCLYNKITKLVQHAGFKFLTRRYYAFILRFQ